MIARSISRRLLLILSVLLLLINGKAFASKYAAAEIYVDYVGSGPKDLRYKVTLIVYHACSEGSPDLSIGPAATEDICYASDICKPSPVTQAIRFRSCDTLKTSCPKAGNSCTDPTSTIPGYYRAVYYDTVDISAYGACADWEFGWWSGTNYRNSLIKNLTLLSPTTTDVRCGINNMGSYYNTSSPRYLMPPVFIYCINQHDVVPTSPYDPNGDSLYTTDKGPWKASDCLQGSHILPQAGYSVYPIDGLSSDPYTVDGYTGTSTITPTTNGIYAIAMQTDKYDPYNKTNLGFCQRDVEIYVQSCAATPPVMDTTPQGLTGGTYDIPSHTINICPGTPLVFNLSSNAPAGTILIMHADNDIAAPGSGFFITGYATNSILSTFRWTPTGKDIGLHTIVFVTADSTCIGNGELPKSYYTLNINVLPSVDAGPDLSYCGPTSRMPQLNVTGVPPDGSFRWSHPIPFGLGFADHLTDSLIADPFAHPDTSTTYVVTYTTADGTPLACKNTDTVRVLVFPPQAHNGGPDQIICLNQTAILNPTFSKLDTFVWLPDPTLSDTTIRKPTVKPVNLGVNTYFIVITDVNKCQYNDSSRVIARDIAPNITAFVTPDTVCPGGSAQLLVNIEEQACGAGIGKCSGTAIDKNIDLGNPNIFIGTNNSYNAQDPTPYQLYYYTGGNRMQIIYTAKELYKAGLNAGYINSIAFDVAKKISTRSDSFRNFTIKMACTTDDHFLPSKSYSGYFVFGSYTFTTVYNKKITGTIQGWNQYLFSTPYYWDGVSNLVVEICSSTQKMGNTAYFTPNGDNMYLVPTENAQTIFTWDNFACCSSGFADGCAWPNNADNNSVASSRPVTRFNFCQSLSNYTIKWNPATNLNNAAINNPVASNIGKSMKYWVQANANSSPGCVSTDTVYITVDTSTMISAHAQDTILCRPGYTYLGADARGKRPLSNLPCGTEHPVACAVPDVVTIANGAKPQIGNMDYTPFKNTSNKTQWIISNKILMNSGMNSGTIREMDLQCWGAGFDGSTFKNVEVRIGCTAKNSFTSAADTVSIRGMVLVYTANTLTVPAPGTLSIPFNIPYNWDTTQNLIIQICYGDMSSRFPQAYIANIPTSYNSMVQYYGYNAFYCGYIANPSYTPVVYRNIPAVTFKYCPAPEGNFGYTWAPGLYLSDSNVQAPEVYVPHSASYTVYTQGRNHCLVKDSVHIYVPVHHFSIYPKDTSVCAGNTVALHAKGGFSYQWYQNGFKAASSLSCQNCANPIASPADTTTYQVVVTDSVFCGDTLYARINVKPIPIVKVLNNDTTINYGSSIQLAAMGANVFNWSPAATLSNPNIVNPVASPTEAVTYVVTGIAADGCTAEDSVRVNINFRGKLYVPSAFTPNGDGKNDRFKVANFTFEKVLEFRVFNRWGQEVFNASDNSGWDGTWKNVPQDIGAYEYLVRVGFPDGFIETFKGSVTLIR